MMLSPLQHAGYPLAASTLAKEDGVTHRVRFRTIPGALSPKAGLCSVGTPLVVLALLGRRHARACRTCRRIAPAQRRQEPATAQTFSTGAPELDQALGGGFPFGRVLEIYGPPQSGKTSLALSSIVGAQNTGIRRRCAFVDADGSMDSSLKSYMLEMGVSFEKLQVITPNAAAEDVVQMIKDLAQGRHFDLIVLDSLPSLIPRVELEGGIAAQRSQFDELKPIFSKFFRQVTPILAQTNTTLLCTNQLRAGFSLFGPREVPFGGQAPGRWSSIRLRVLEPKVLESDDYSIGLRCNVEIVKFAVDEQKQAATGAHFDLIFGKGIGQAEDVDLTGEISEVQELSA